MQWNLTAMARLRTLLYGALSGQTFPEDVPAFYAAKWDIHYLHDRIGPTLTERETDFIRAYADKSIRTVQALVFPYHGL